MAVTPIDNSTASNPRGDSILYIKLLTLLVTIIVVCKCIKAFLRISMLIQIEARQICSHDSVANNFENISFRPFTEAHYL